MALIVRLHLVARNVHYALIHLAVCAVGYIGCRGSFCCTFLDYQMGKRVSCLYSRGVSRNHISARHNEPGSARRIRKVTFRGGERQSHRTALRLSAAIVTLPFTYPSPYQGFCFSVSSATLSGMTNKCVNGQFFVAHCWWRAQSSFV